MSTEEARGYKPSVVFVDQHNRVVSLGDDPADAPADSGLLRGDLVAQ
jgi:aspartate 1-decarboxylase